MMNDQAREPRGIPNGGQYSTMALGEADFELDELTDAEYNADGTFSFPPSPRSLKQIVAFWRSVPVADSILLRMRAKHTDYQYQMRQDAVEEFKRANPEPEKFRWGKPNPDYQIWLDGQARAEAEVDAAYPREIPAQWARQIARATRMHLQARVLDVASLDPDDPRIDDYDLGEGPNAERVANSTVDLGVNGPVPIGRLLNKFRTHDLDEDIWYDQQVRDISLISQSLSRDLE